MTPDSTYSNRRIFLKSAALATASLLASIKGISGKKAPAIVLRSSWQTVNIGDIGHTPGVLSLLEKYLPDASIRLWPSSVGNGVEELLKRRFPRVSIVQTPEEIAATLKECDFLLHGSGPSLVARKDVERWHRETGKPFGIYGITFPGVYAPGPAASKVNPLDVELLNHARFAFFRDSVSLEVAKEIGIKSPTMAFCPDGAFAVDFRNDQAATAFLSKHGLEAGKFLCVIPRTRFTPYWEIPAKKTPFDAERNAINQQMKEQDNAPLREAMIAVVRQTGLKILIVPEDETQVKLGKEILLDKLPDDVKKNVVWRDRYWLTDEALSTYLLSAGLFGLEMHSPIMCIGHGIPAIVCRFAEQTSKGIMWRDIGLGDWLFDMDKPEEVARVVPAVLAMAKDPKAAKAKAAKARLFVEKRQRETMAILKTTLIG
ncbi:polysaccharide pyruvyl transferase family protein [Larkinella sp. C7]|jgi:polysaccharide pyruvyl transferase WcaK-like protein|uniref:polysaccharide pyruvyl transferase family protein n=1 Tax=Larkinella sp. C7 TaxID=2576607 RepID=UPI00111111FA|nr:polysaccharide pyruvyl transferase family protein [Larkinella sp. C7]